jgi:hypothetical protein
MQCSARRTSREDLRAGVMCLDQLAPNARPPIDASGEKRGPGARAASGTVTNSSLAGCVERLVRDVQQPNRHHPLHIAGSNPV